MKQVCPDQALNPLECGSQLNQKPTTTLPTILGYFPCNSSLPRHIDGRTTSDKSVYSTNSTCYKNLNVFCNFARWTWTRQGRQWCYEESPTTEESYAGSEQTMNLLSSIQSRKTSCCYNLIVMNLIVKRIYGARWPHHALRPFCII